ncbi:MAG: DUF2800 domain-containing protein [Ruminococcus sp.]|nr:DUF2800 domain-containing protein [Ruminococcus sp.]
MPRKKQTVNTGIPPNMVPPDHASRAHAVLSASAAKRWLNCTPSARLNE